MTAPSGVCWVVSGRVQGVGFRWFVRQHAVSHRLVGYTRNLPDGRVEVAACGEPDDLAALRSVLVEGPPLASVRDVVEASYPRRIDSYTTFEIR